MHRYFSLLLMAGIAGMLWSCRAPFRNIEFGNFGGVTGGKYAYRVDANGKIWQGDQMIGRLPDNVRHSLKKEVAQFLKEPPTPFRYPANMNHFIQINTKDTILYYQWGGAKMPPSSIETLYQHLWQWVKPFSQNQNKKSAQ